MRSAWAARGSAAQTIFPPSVHVSGEPIEEWEDGGPSKITDIDDGDELLQHALVAAQAAAEIARNYPKVGGRHAGAFVPEASWRAAGFRRLRDGAGVRRSGRRRLIMQLADKRCDMARTARDGASAGETRRNFPLLAETFGADTATKIADWLGYKGGDEGGGTAAPGENDAADSARLLTRLPERSSPAAAEISREQPAPRGRRRADRRPIFARQNFRRSRPSPPP